MADIMSNSAISAMYNNMNNTSAATEALQKKLDKTDLSNSTDEELMQVCKDFESYFVEQVFKSMEKMAHIDQNEDDKDSTMSGYATQMKDYFQGELITEYAKAASESNGGEGLGIAQMLYEQMKREKI